MSKNHSLSHSFLQYLFLTQDSSLLASKRSELEEMEGMCVSLQLKSKEAEEAVQRSQDHYQAVTAGLSSGSDGQDETLAAQKIGQSSTCVYIYTHYIKLYTDTVILFIYTLVLSSM